MAATEAILTTVPVAPAVSSSLQAAVDSGTGPCSLTSAPLASESGSSPIHGFPYGRGVAMDTLRTGSGRMGSNPHPSYIPTARPDGVRQKAEGAGLCEEAGAAMGLTIGVDIGGTKIAAGVVDNQ